MEKHTHVFEFDFKSFFNTVPRAMIYRALERNSTILADLILSVLRNIRYVFDELKPEKEIIDDSLFMRKLSIIMAKMFPRKPILVREGVPQGLSISPLLAVMALETTVTPRNLVMYADDGLIFGGSQEDKDKWFLELQELGIQMEANKSGPVGNEFRFLGTT